MSWQDFLPPWLRRWIPVKPAPPKPTPGPPPGPAPIPGDIAAELLIGHNRVRINSGLGPYVNHAVLIQVAQEQAEFQAARDRIGHDGPGGNSPWDRLSRAGYAWALAGENAAAGQRNAAEAVADWLTSPGHRANVLGNYTEMGGGMARSARGTQYWTCVYATPGRMRLETAAAVLPSEAIQTPHGQIL